MTARKTLSCAIVALIASIGCRATEAGPPPPQQMVTWTVIDKAKNKEGPPLVYTADAQGNRIIDFSYAGYRGGDAPIPNVPAIIQVPPNKGDSTALIQAAIDKLATEPLVISNSVGTRGAVQLSPGTYEVSGQLKIWESGIVLRGAGTVDGGTTLLATGLDRRPLIVLGGKNDRKIAATQPVSQEYVPVNSMQVTLSSAHDIKVGDAIIIRRPSTAAWITELGMDDFGGDRHGPSWKPGSREIEWDRVVTKVDGATISFDAPITAALDSKFGGGYVGPYTWPSRVSNSGVENLKCESTFDKSNPKDEDHSWYAVTIENASDCWVRRMTATGFSGSAVAVWETANRVTVEDCKYLAPVSEIGGWRRNAFFTTGQQVLMQRLYSEDARHDFAVGFCAAGPNAFVQCESARSLGESGAIDSWSCGTLFDMVRIDGKEISLRNREYRGQGQGWSAANSVIWNSSAAVIECPKPPTAMNYAIGTWGEFSGNGYWYASNDDPIADTLYYSQRADRLGKRDARLMPSEQDASSNPAPGALAPIIELSKHPRPNLSTYIDSAAKLDPISVKLDGLPKASPPPVPQPAAPTKSLSLTNGWLTIDGGVVVGGNSSSTWWNGTIRTYEMQPKSALTRFVPGRSGAGYTDEIEDVADKMSGKAFFLQFPPLWYDRRRDDHERVQRADGDVVAPFYEWPVARSGQGIASDGLSKWDLTKPNPFYFNRLKKFAELGAYKGYTLINMHYMQHSILEAGAHYFDYAWRPANNINNMLLPEPPYFAGDKRIFIGEQFYDITVPERAALHKQYIRHELDLLGDQSNVIHLTSNEYTGDLRFMQFWLDTVAEWEKEHNKQVLVGLHGPKDVTDAILADPVRSKIVSVIYVNYNGEPVGWWYQPDGKLYAPQGGQNLSPRQLYRLAKTKNAGFAQVYKAVSEYRTKYPDKAFIYVGDDNPDVNWAALLGGASFAVLDKKLDPDFRAALARTLPVPDNNAPSGVHQYVLGNDSHDFILYTDGRALPKLGRAQFNYTVRAINPKNYEVTALPDISASKEPVEIKAPFSPAVIWLTAK